MKAGAVATPLAFVITVTVTEPFTKVPLAPLDGAVNVTGAPVTGLFPEFLTVACSATPKVVLIVVL